MIAQKTEGQNGFTILEVLVALALFAIVATAAFALFHDQTREGASTALRKIAFESVAHALRAIERDVLNAGLGLRDKPQLAIWVVQGSGSNPDELYLSCSDHLDMALVPTQNWSFFANPANPIGGRAWFPVTSATKLPLLNVSALVDQTSFGTLIMEAFPHYLPPDSSGFNVPPPAPPTPTQIANNLHDLTLQWSGTLTTNVAPAIAYRLKLDSDTSLTGESACLRMGRLIRNNTVIVGADTAVIAGQKTSEPRPFAKITAFKIRCQYIDPTTQNLLWSPDNCNFNSYPAAQIRVIEITLRYIVRDVRAGYQTPNDIQDPNYRIVNDLTVGPWMIGGARTLRVSPRNIVLTQYL